MRRVSGKTRNIGSLGIVTSLILMAFLATGPTIVIAPPLQGTLDVTFHDLAPNTNTFPGDMNVTMIQLEMSASGGNVRVTSIVFTISGNIQASDISGVALWDESDPSQSQQFFECELGKSSVATLTFTIPQSQTLQNCAAPGGNYIVNDTDTRFITVFLSVSATAILGDNLRLSVDTINTDGTVNGGTGTTRTIDVNTILFQDDMESGQGDWTFSGGDEGGQFPNGLWHLSSGEEACDNNNIGLPFYHSDSTSWWYGHRYEHPLQPTHFYCEYYTWRPPVWVDKTRNWGTLTSPVIDASMASSLALTLFYMIATEPDIFGPADNGYVWLYDGAWHKIGAEHYDTTGLNWWKLTLNLSAYAGKSIKLEFRLDTIDEINNNNLGWMIDDLTVYGKVEAHDIHVSENNAPPVVSPSGASLDVSARYTNLGTNDETNIGTKLTVNNITKDTGTIPSLLSRESVVHTLSWNPTVAGENHWICMEADPVSGENILWNNKDCRVVSVRDTPAHYVYVLRSGGTSKQVAKDTWDHLNTNWASYGGDQVIIDYTSLDIPSITYADISGQFPKPDVLVISSSAGWTALPPPNAEFSDTETAAITKYVLESHGLLLTGTVFNERIPNNNDLASLVGVKQQGYRIGEEVNLTMDIDTSCAGHPLFTGVNDPFPTSFDDTMTPPSGSWVSGDLTTGQYCARSAGQSAAIVVNKGVYLISFGAEMSIANDNVYQLLYNAMVTAEYQVFDHDVKAESIAAPNYARVGYPINVSATITNIGKNDESVDVKLMVNLAQQDISNIFLTHGGDFLRVTLSYTPSAETDDNVCMKAEIVGFTDGDPTNNEVCKVVKAKYNPPVQVFILDSWGTDNATLAPWSHLNSFWSSYGDTPVYIDWTTFNKESIQYQELADMNANVLVISSSYTGMGENPDALGYRFTPAEMDAIKQYTQEGHGIIITGGTFDTSTLPDHVAQLGSLMGISSGGNYMTTSNVLDLVVQNPGENHPLFVNIPNNYNTRDGTSLTPGFSVTGPEPWDPIHLNGGVYKALQDSPTPYGAVIAYEPGDYHAVYITNFVERQSNTYDKQLLYNAMVWGRSTVKAPSNLWIELANGNVDLKLTWTENPSSKLQGYNIYRADAVDTFNLGAPIATLPPGTVEYIDFGMGVGNVNNYYYIVRAFDDNGNEEANRNMVGKYVITLYPKFNEISLPFELKDPATSVVFSQLGTNWDSIAAYDAVTGTWLDWKPTGGLLTNVDHKMGLRVKMKNNAPITDFVTVGRVPVMTDIVLYHELPSNYWNFVGFPRHLTTSLPQALDNYGMVGKYDLVLWFDPLDKKARWKWFDPNDPNGSPLTELKPGMGIWVHTSQAGTWSLPGS